MHAMQPMTGVTVTVLSHIDPPPQVVGHLLGEAHCIARLQEGQCVVTLYWDCSLTTELF